MNEVLYHLNFTEEKFRNFFYRTFSSVGKESAYNAGDPGLFLGQEDSLEKG